MNKQQRYRAYQLGIIRNGLEEELHEIWRAEQHTNYDGSEDAQLATAISQGMTLREYLEFGSAESWTNRQRESGAA